MGRYLNIGNAGFQAMTKDVYVDKTEMISFINSTLGKKRKLTCVSRPRRFGKSYAAQMLCAYYDKGCDSKKLFEGLAISKDSSFGKFLNKYDVIYMDITLFLSKTSNAGNVVKNMNDEVSEDVCRIYPDVKRSSSLAETLFNAAEKNGNKFIMIIDEWDAIFREVKDDAKLQEEYIMFLRSLFKSNWTDMIFEAVYMTGILPIKKYGNQSAVSDFREYTMLSPGKLAKYIGFTEPEVMELCKEYEVDFEAMKCWYDGYSFRQLKSVYSPDSVMEAIERNEFGSYWARTETFESLKAYIDLNEDGLKEAIVQMLGGERVLVDAGTFQNDMTNIKRKDDVITLLIHLGYLAYDADKKAAYIPNEEVKQEFIRAAAAGKHTEIANLIRNSDNLLRQTLNMDEKAVADAIEEAHKAAAAPISYNNEEALRSTIKMAYISCMDEYIVIDELPSGHGYADIAYIPKRASSLPVILIELKWNKTDLGAISQIKRRDYPQALKDYGGDILLVGINYDTKSNKHTCRIEKYDEL